MNQTFYLGDPERPARQLRSCAVAGRPGMSAYELALSQGFTGGLAQWLATLVGPGVPAGGTAGQVLVKRSDADYDCAWVTLVPGQEAET